MSRRRRGWFWFGIAVCVVAASPLVLVESLYRCGLSAAGALPEKPKSAPLTRAHQALWAIYDGGPMRMEATWPWTTLGAVWRAVARNEIGRAGLPDLVARLFIGQELERGELKGRTLKRAWVEWAIAVWFSRHLSADELLLWTGERLPLGEGIIGVDDAAKHFGVVPGQLTWAQAALLAGVAQAPTRYDPELHPDAARKRRHWVLERLRDEGVISSEEFAQSDAAPLK